MNQRTIISRSRFANEFSDARVNTIYQLSNRESQLIWDAYIHKNASSFFKLPDTCWVISSSRVSLGQWLDDFNAEKHERVKRLLEESISWTNKDIIWFCINRNVIIEAQWEEFKMSWINFLYCSDDCPIVINSSGSHCAVIFKPIGSIMKIGSC